MVQQPQNLTGLSNERWSAVLEKHPEAWPETYIEEKEILGSVFLKSTTTVYDQSKTDAQGNAFKLMQCTRSIRVWGDTPGHVYGRLETTTLSKAASRILGKDDPYFNMIDPIEEALNSMEAVKIVEQMFLADMKEKSIIEWIESNTTGKTTDIAREKFSGLKANKKG